MKIASILLALFGVKHKTTSVKKDTDLIQAQDYAWMLMNALKKIHVVETKPVLTLMVAIDADVQLGTNSMTKRNNVKTSMNATVSVAMCVHSKLDVKILLDPSDVIVKTVSN